MLELKDFIARFKEQIPLQEDKVTQIKASIKNILSQLQYQYREFLANKAPESSLQSLMRLHQPFQIIQSQELTQEQNKKKECVQELDKLYMLTKLIHRPEILMSKIKNYAQSVKKLQAEFQKYKNSEAFNPNFEILHILQLVTQLLKSQHLLGGFSPLPELLKQVQDIFTDYLDGLMAKINKDSQNEFQVALQQEENFKNALTENQLKCPLIEPSLLDQATANLFFTMDQNFLENMKNNQILIKQLSHEQVFQYQRYLLSYKLKKLLFKIDLPPGFVIRISQLHPQKKYFYFFVTLDVPKSPLNLLAKQHFAIQYIANLITDHFEMLIPEYYGNFQPSYHQDLPANLIQNYNSFRNPLYYYKGLICNQEFKNTELNVNFLNFHQGFIDWLSFLIGTQLFDFQFPQKVNQDASKRKRSLQLNEKSIQLTHKKVRQLQDSFQQAIEVIFNQQGHIYLHQITKSTNHIILDFMKLDTQMCKDVQDYNTHISKMDLNELLPQVVSSSELFSYNQKINDVTMSAIENGISQTFMTFERESNQETSPIFKSKSLFKFFVFSPKRFAQQFFANLNLSYDVNLRNRIEILDYFALQNLFIDVSLRYLHFEILQELLKQFNYSWRNQQSWDQAFKANYSVASKSPFQHQFFVEALSIIFLEKNILGHSIFDSIASLQENQSNISHLIFYLQGPLKQDYGYGKHQTITEAALKHKKFQILLTLLQIGEGRKIDLECFNYLLEHQVQYETSVFFSQKLLTDETVFHSKIFGLINEIHPQIIRRLKWDHFWTERSKYEGDEKLIIHYRGVLGRTYAYFKKNELDQLLKPSEHKLPEPLELHLLQSSGKKDGLDYKTMRTSEDEPLLLFFQPTYPLCKLMNYSLHRLLQLDQFQSRIELVEYQNSLHCVYEIYPAESGMTLSKFFQTERIKMQQMRCSSDDFEKYFEQQLTEHLGEETLGFKIFLSILLLQSEVSPEMEFLYQSGSKYVPVTHNLYIDPNYDSGLNASGFVREGDQLKLNCKNIYFLCQFMHQKISKSVISKFSNIVLQLQQWMKQLASLNLCLNLENHQRLVFPFNKDNVVGLTKRAYILQQATVNDTYLQLLARCDAMLAFFYAQYLNNKSLSIMEKFQQIAYQERGFNKFLCQQEDPSFFEHFQWLKYPQKFDYQQSFAIGPSKALHILRKYHRFSKSKTLEDFHRKIDILKKQAHWQTFLQSMHWGQFNDKEIGKMFEQMSKLSKDQNRVFNFFAFDRPNYSNIASDLRSLDLTRIKIMILKNASSLTDRDIIEFSIKCNELHFLHISGSAIYYFQDNGKPIRFKSLKTFICQNMPYLSTIEIQSDTLLNIKVEGSQKLATIYAYKCSRLQNLWLTNCPSLQKEIVFLWILQGKQVHLDQSTSQGAFKEFLLRSSIISLEQSISQKVDLQAKYYQILSQAYISTNKQDVTYLTILQKIGLFDETAQLSGIFKLWQKPDLRQQAMKALFTSIFMNQNINELDLLSLMPINQENKRELLDSIIEDITAMLRQEMEKNEESPFQNHLKNFFSKIESITIPHTTESILNSIANLIAMISKQGKTRQNLAIRFSKLKNIRDGSIIKFLETINKNKNPSLAIHLLDFSQNSLSEENIRNIFESTGLQNLKVQILILQSAGINDKMLETVNERFWDFQALQILDLSNNHITKVGLNALLKKQLDLKRKYQISSLNLSQNYLGDAKFSLLYKLEEQNLLANPSLGSLHLSNIFKCDMDISEFCTFIAQTNKLANLDLSDSCLNPDQVFEMSLALQENKSIKKLTYSNYYQSNNSATYDQLLEKILEKQNSTIQELELIYEKDYQISNLLYDMISFDSLHLLTLNFKNQITIPILQKILEAQRKSKLRKLEIKINENINQDTGIKVMIAKLNNINSNAQPNILQPSRLEAAQMHKLNTVRVQQQEYTRLGLSIDGGGIRGLLPATMINYLCTELKREPHEIFEIIGGTSIGGILALGMTGTIDGIHPLCNKDQIVEIFTLHGQDIFEKAKRNVIYYFSKSKYDPQGIESVLSKYMGAAKLSDVLPGTNAIVTALKLEKTWQDNMAKVFSSKQAKVDQSENFLMRDVGRATSAAPTFFPAAEIKSFTGKTYQLVDGGVGKNNPSNLVLENLKKGLSNEERDNFFLLSLSTGISKVKAQMKMDQGLLNVAQIIDAFGIGNQDFVDLELQAYKGKYLRVVPEFNLPENKAQLDCTEPEVLKEFSDVARSVAERAFNEEKWGRLNDQSLIRWFAQNIDRRRDGLLV